MTMAITEGQTAVPTTETPNTTEPAPNGATDGGGSDLEQLQATLVDRDAELARVKRAHGTLLNEKGKGRAERERLVEMLKPYTTLAEEFEVDPDDIREALESSHGDGEDGQAGGDTTELDKRLAKQKTRYERELAKREKATAELQGRYDTRSARDERMLIDRALGEELAKYVEPALVKGAAALLGSSVRAVEDAGAEYGIAIMAERDGENLPIGEAIKQWAEADPEATPYLLRSKSSGGGAPPMGRSGGAGLKRSTMGVAEKSQFLSTHGQERYNSLPW
jgi:hypothetical protein